MRCKWIWIQLLLVAPALHAAEARPRILDGTTVPESTFPTVGRVGDATEPFFCSGTLIAPHAVLAAAHTCVSDQGSEQSVADSAGRFTLGGVAYRTAKIHIHPTWRGGIEQEGEFDLALLVLDAPVPGVAPSPLLRRPPQAGERLTLAGYGSQGTGARGEDDTFPAEGSINFGYTTIQEVTGTFVRWTFDPGESDTASGDSGGPAFLTIDGQLVLAGVTSGGSGDGFGNTSYDSRVDSVVAWIESILGPLDSGGGGGGGGGNGGVLEIVSGPSATPSPARIGQPVQFQAAASAAGVAWRWDFGDGTTDSSGGAVAHLYAAAGTFTVSVTATDAAKGQTAGATLLLQVRDVQFVNVPASRKRFQLSFSAPERSKFEITLSDSRLSVLERGTGATVYFGERAIDRLQFEFGTGYGEQDDSIAKWNSRRSELRYKLSGETVNEVLQEFGARDADAESRVAVPFSIELDGTRYGGEYVFDYKARAGRSGKGR